MLWIIGGLVFASVGLTTYELLRPRPNPLLRRAGGARPDPRAVERTQGNILRRTVGPTSKKWGTRLSTLLPQNFVRSIEQRLIMADEPWSLPGFLFTWASMGAVGVVLFYYIAYSNPALTPLQVMTVAIAVVPTTLVLPYAVLRNRVRLRQKAIVRALPDAMDLLVTSIEAGLGVDAAFALVAEKTSGPISDTVALYLRAVGLGQSRRDALTMAAQRTGVPELIGVAYAVNQAETMGSTLGDVLRIQGEELRVLRRQRAEAAAQRAPVLMTIPLVTCFLPAMAAVVLVPSVLNLLKFTGGIGGG